MYLIDFLENINKFFKSNVMLGLIIYNIAVIFVVYIGLFVC